MEQLLILLLAGFFVYCWMRLVGKTGNSQWLGLLIMIPVVNLALVIWLAFSDWPVHRRLRDQDSDTASQD